MDSARSTLTNWIFTIGFMLFGFFLLLIAPKNALAQTTNVNSYNSNSYYNSTSIDPNVARNQHNNVQITTIELMSSLLCQITGIDPINPSVPCLGVNPQTNKIGYAPVPTLPNGQPQIGGLIGTATGMISYTFQPMATTGIYVNYLSENFGLVNNAYADHKTKTCVPSKQGYGFCGLMPVFHLWESVRNISYALLVLALTFIGIGVMLRVKIDPRTVMTIQNQIPKVIVAIILITFSYAISAVLVDLMWTTTYAGVNAIVNSTPEARDVNIKGNETLAEKANKQLLEIPIVYAHGIFHTQEDTGITYLTKQTAQFVGGIISDVVQSILGSDDDNAKCISRLLPPRIDFGECVGDALGFLATIAAKLILFFVLIIALFKIWFNLLKAFVFTLLYIIISPVYIVFGLLPSKPLGFEAWLRRFFANIAVFPLTVYILVGARVLMDAFNTGTPNQFIPPLVGHNLGQNFGALLALGAILIAPSLQTILREKLGVKQIGTPGIVAAGIASGAAVVGAPVGRAMKHLNRYDPRTGEFGALARLKRGAGEKTLDKLSHAPKILGGEFFGKAAEREKRLYETGNLHGFDAKQAASARIEARNEHKSGLDKNLTWRERRKKLKEFDRTYGTKKETPKPKVTGTTVSDDEENKS